MKLGRQLYLGTNVSGFHLDWALQAALIAKWQSTELQNGAERKAQNEAMRYFSSSSKYGKYGDCIQMAICAFEGKFFHFWLQVEVDQK